MQNFMAHQRIQVILLQSTKVCKNLLICSSETRFCLHTSLTVQNVREKVGLYVFVNVGAGTNLRKHRFWYVEWSSQYLNVMNVQCFARLPIWPKVFMVQWRGSTECSCNHCTISFGILVFAYHKNYFTSLYILFFTLAYNTISCAYFDIFMIGTTLCVDESPNVSPIVGSHPKEGLLSWNALSRKAVGMLSWMHLNFRVWSTLFYFINTALLLN